MGILDLFRGRRELILPSGEAGDFRPAKSSWDGEAESLQRILRSELGKVQNQWDQSRSVYKQLRNRARLAIKGEPREIHNKLLWDCLNIKDRMDRLFQRQREIEQLSLETEVLLQHHWRTLIEEKMVALASGTPATNPEIQKLHQTHATIMGQKLEELENRTRKLLEVGQSFAGPLDESKSVDDRIKEMRAELEQELQQEGPRWP